MNDSIRHPQCIEPIRNFPSKSIGQLQNCGDEIPLSFDDPVSLLVIVPGLRVSRRHAAAAGWDSLPVQDTIFDTGVYLTYRRFASFFSPNCTTTVQKCIQVALYCCPLPTVTFPLSLAVYVGAG